MWPTFFLRSLPTFIVSAPNTSLSLVYLLRPGPHRLDIQLVHPPPPILLQRDSLTQFRERYTLVVILSVCVFVCLFVCLSVCVLVCLFVCHSACLSVCLLFACLCVGLPVCLSVICLFVCWSVCLSVCYLPVCDVGLPVCLSVICLFVML